jgi:thioredoxin reductase
MQEKTPLLIVGAGPFGLSLAAYLKHKNVEHIHLGHSMDYWKNHMPKKMYLRSACDWHLDADNEDTILKYLNAQNLTPADVEPLSLEFYLGYVNWFQSQKGLAPRPAWVKRLSRANDSFHAVLDDGSEIEAQKVVLAVGLRHFKNIPEEYKTIFPEGTFHHTAELADFSVLKDKRTLIIGGRQSAFEWAALIHENGAQEVHLAYRHDTPAFESSEWSWVNPILQDMIDQPAWFRNLAQEEKDQVSKRMWKEGRLKLEPWLVKRISKETIVAHPHTYVTACEQMPSKELKLTLNDKTTLTIDHVILATGYKVNIAQIPMLTADNLADQIQTKNGFPVLDEGFQSSVPNLYFTGFAAAQDFGPFFGFTAAVRTSALIIGRKFI